MFPHNYYDIHAYTINILFPHTHTHTLTHHPHTPMHAVSDDMTLFPESQSRQFLMFLTRANRYPTLHLGGGDSPYTTRKVVLVEVSEVYIHKNSFGKRNHPSNT